MGLLEAVLRPLGGRLGEPLWRRRWSFVSIFEQPVLFWIIIQWVNHLWHQLILLRDLEHGSRVFMPATVVSC